MMVDCLIILPCWSSPPLKIPSIQSSLICHRRTWHKLFCVRDAVHVCARWALNTPKGFYNHENHTRCGWCWRNVACRHPRVIGRDGRCRIYRDDAEFYFAHLVAPFLYGGRWSVFRIGREAVGRGDWCNYEIVLTFHSSTLRVVVLKFAPTHEIGLPRNLYFS